MRGSLSQLSPAPFSYSCHNALQFTVSIHFEDIGLVEANQQREGGYAQVDLHHHARVEEEV
jgi:hypothetical protein